MRNGLEQSFLISLSHASVGFAMREKNTSHSQLPVISDELPLSCLTPFDYLLLVRQNVVQKSLQCVRMSHDFFIESGKFYTT